MPKSMLQSISSTPALVNSEATPSEVFLGKGVLKNAANLQENTHAKV